MRFSLAANRRLLVAAALWGAVAVSGQELTRTQIADTLFNANGSRAVGSLRISWKSFTGADGSTVAKNSVDLDIVDGIVSVALAPNLGAVPDGTYYSVEYRLHKGEKSNELWIVPDSEDSVRIADIRVLSVPAAGMSVSLAQVSGLPAALDAKADRAGVNTFMAPQVLREDAPGTSNPLLGLQKNDGSAGVYLRLPELSGDVTYTLPPNAGSPNQALTTDGSGALFWSSAAGGGAGSGSAYEVLQQGGTSVTQRTVANFTGGFLVSDNSGQLRTDITPNFGTAAGTITQGNDSRLSNARTPLAHASTHGVAGSDPVTPASIGALNRTNDFMVGTSPTTPVLKLQGSTGQAAALQEWRDGSGGLAALITAQGNGFFRELGVSAPTGGTTVSQFFELGGLKKFALSATDAVFDILRYDNSGLFLDRPLRVFRNGNIETTVSVKVADAGIGSGALGLTGNYVELQGVAAPANPTSGFGRLFLNSATGEVSVKKSSGSIVSLESGGGGGGGGDFLGNFASPTELTLSSGSVTFPGSGAYVLDTQSDAASDDWTGATCPAGASFSIQAANDARTVVIKASSIATPTSTDLLLNQDGDSAMVLCRTADTPEVILFADEDGQQLYGPVDGGQGLTGTTTRPPGTARIQLSRHVDSCAGLVDGLDGEICTQENTDKVFRCETADGACDAPAEWAPFVRLDVATTKGDTIVFNGTDYVRLPVGTSNQVLIADAAQPAGVKWAAPGLETLLVSSKNAAASCAGSSSWATLLSVSITAGTLAAANTFVIEGQVSATTPTSDADAQLLIGGNVVRLAAGINSGATFHASCFALSATSIHCGEQTFDDSDSNSSSNAAVAVSDISSNALAIELQYRNCASDSALTGNYLFAAKRGI